MKPTVQSGTGASPKKTPTSTPSKQPAAGAVEGAGEDKENKEEGAVVPAPEGTNAKDAAAAAGGETTPGVSAVETARRVAAESVAGVKASIGKVIPFKQNFGILRLPRLSSLLLSTLC